MTVTLQQIASTLHDSEFPRQVTLELCAFCNCKCIMCPHPTMQRSKGFMSEELYRKCIDEIAEADLDMEVWLADHGESLIIGEEIINKLIYAKSRGLRKVFLNTNGMLLNRSIARGFVENGLDGIFFGIDGATPATHAAIRRGAKLDAVVGNIDGLLAEKARNGYSKPEVWVQFIEMDENEGEREAFTEFWHERNVGVKIRRKLSWGGYITTAVLEREMADRIPCPWIMNLIHILWDGSVCRCTGDHENNYPMGNLHGSSIRELWTGPMRRERMIHLEYRFNDLNQQCKKCLDWKVGAAERLPVGAAR